MEQKQNAANQLDFALGIWNAAQPLQETIGERYLSETRKIDVSKLPPTINEGTSTTWCSGESMSDFEDDFGEMPGPASTPASFTSTLSFEDFCAYAPTRTFIYLPCRTPWPNASIDTRLPRRPLLDANGNPVRNKGKVVTISASTWLEQNRSV